MKRMHLLLIIITLFLSFYSIAQSNVIENALIFRVNNSMENSSKSLQPKDVINDFLKSEFNLSANEMFKNKGKSKSNDVSVLSDIFIVQLNSTDDYHKCFTELNNKAEVLYVQPYYVPHLLNSPNDPKINSQYALYITNALEAFNISTGDTNMVIGIVDTGVDADHEDLMANIKINYADPVNGIDDDLDGYVDNFRGWDIAMNDPNPECTETQPHGVLVSGIAAAVTNNGVGIAGAGYNCKFLPIKISDEYDRLTAAYQGIVYAADHGCKIINCSWGDTVPNQVLQDVIDYAVKTRGCVVVASAGNTGKDVSYYPASCEGVFSVGATNWSDVKWENSNFGTVLDICAPGVGILTTQNKGGYSSNWVNGTSYSAPMVSGAAALLWSKKPELTNEQVLEQLRISADVIDTIYENSYYKYKMGYGRLNVNSALQNDTTPSVRIVDTNIKSSAIKHFAGGDTLSIVIALKNYLANAKSCLVELSTDSKYVTVIDDFYNAGNIKTFETKLNESYPFRIVLHNEIPFNHKVQLLFKMLVNGKDDYQIFDLELNPSYINVKGDKISTTFTSNGFVGYSNPGKRTGRGVVYNNIYSLLNRGGVIIGTDKYHIASAIENSEFSVVEIIDTVVYEDRITGSTVFKPNENKWNSGLRIEQVSEVFTNKSNEGIVLHKYSVFNEGVSNLEEVRFGLFADWDIWEKYANKAKYDNDLKMVYTYSTKQIIMYAGIVLLSDYEALPYCFDMGNSGNGGIDISSDFSDEKKMLAISNSRESTVAPSFDVATLLSVEPFNLKVSEAVELNFAFIVANNLLELKEKALELKLKFNAIGIREKKSGVFIYPNPASETIHIAVENYSDPVTAKVFNVSGYSVDTYTNIGSFEINVRDYLPGVYFLKIVQNNCELNEIFIVKP